MMRAENIRSLSDFRQNATTCLDRLAQTGEAEVLTVNGQAKGVVMSPAAFDRLCRLAHEMEVMEGIRQGLADMDAGRGVEGERARRELAEKLGFKQRS